MLRVVQQDELEEVEGEGTFKSVLHVQRKC